MKIDTNVGNMLLAQNCGFHILFLYECVIICKLREFKLET